MKITYLHIFSANISEQYRFYHEELGLEVENYKEKSFDLIAGYTRVKFEFSKDAKPYHFAFHIPDKQEDTALKWLDGKVKILEFNSDKIVDFPAWNAKSIYFYDKDQNIVEFIARKDQNPPNSAIFSGKSLVGIAEIGLVTNNVSKIYDTLKIDHDLKRYDGDFEKFCAIGDDAGLIISINNSKKDWFPQDDKAFQTNFSIQFQHEGKEHQLQYKNGELKQSIS